MSGRVVPGTQWSYFAMSLVILVADQATKILAHAHLRGSSAVVVVPGLFNLTYSRNPGGLFGYFGDLADPWRSILLTAMPLVAIALIGVFLARGADAPLTTRIGLASILGGAVGNLVDRVVRGEVVDFLDVYASTPALADWLVRTFGTAHWPTFNVADSCIVVGAGLLIVEQFRPHARTDPAGGESATPAGHES